MSLEQDPKPRKVTVDQVEVIDRQGRIVKESDHSSGSRSPFGGQFGNVGGMKVMKMSPWMLLAVPIILPFLIFGLVVMIFLAVFFGKTVFKVLKKV